MLAVSDRRLVLLTRGVRVVVLPLRVIIIGDEPEFPAPAAPIPIPIPSPDPEFEFDVDPGFEKEGNPGLENMEKVLDRVRRRRKSVRAVAEVSP